MRVLLDVGADKDAKEYVRAARIIVHVHLVLFLTRVCENVQVSVQPPCVEIAPLIVLYSICLCWMALLRLLLYVTHTE